MFLPLVSLVIFLLLGVPIAYSLGLSAAFYFLFFRPELMVVLPQQFFAGMDSYVLIALPLFILMGLLMNISGITAQLINFCLIFVGRFRGGLGLVNVVASMLFGGISGSSASDTASIGSILIPEMEQRGYPKYFAAGITVASSTMGMIIPPSIPMVIYAVTAQESVGKLFLGGLVPGIIVGVSQLAIMFCLSQRRSYPQERRSLSVRTIATECFLSVFVFIMPIVVVGSVVAGIATATESAGIGVVYAMGFGVVMRRLTLDKLYQALRSSILISARIMIIIAMSQVFIWMLAYERIPETLSELVVSLELPPTLMMLCVAVIILLVGTFIDVSPAILLLTPVFLPAIVQVGISPVLFGVVLVSGLAVGACTPPVGNCLNVCSAVTGLQIGTIFRGAAMFLLANVMVLVLIILFPQLVMWLPTSMMD